MANADIERVMDVGMDRLFEVITKYEDYAEFLPEVKSVKVERPGPDQARVTYHISMIKEITYTVDQVENKDKGEISWNLVDSNAF